MLNSDKTNAAGLMTDATGLNTASPDNGPDSSEYDDISVFLR